MRLVVRGCSLALVLALVLTGCSAAGASSESAQRRLEQQAAARRAEATAKIDAARKLVNEGKYDAAVDAYVAVAAASRDDSATTSQALLGASLALNRKVDSFRLPGQLAAVAAFYERLPAGTRPEAAQGILKDFLLDPLAREAKEAESLLADRRTFVKDIRDKGSAEVLLTPDKDRLLTEAEAKAALSRLPELHVDPAYTQLYRSAVPLSSTMDRFLADDKKYLDGKTVSAHDLSELEKSCNVLADALWPVQRQLDRLKPGWR
jgi:hypothetical protein